MGMLVNGQWSQDEPEGEFGRGADGAFYRTDSAFRDRITRDGSSGFKAEPGRYHLYASLNCPWAHRTLIFRAVKGLQDAISVSHDIPNERTYGRTYGPDPRYPDCEPDTANGFKYLYQAYQATNPTYTGKVTVPTLWDKKSKRIVNNESSEIIRMFNSAFVGVAGNDKDFYPEPLRAEIDQINAKVYNGVNNGVYRCGFAKTQEAYDAAFDLLFATLDELEDRLSRQRYLVGNQITEADWRLLPTLLRFDAAYFHAFKCNKKRIADYPNLLNFARELYQVPGVAETVKPRFYVLGYFSIARVNPNGIIPRGTPAPDFSAPHDRGRFAN